MGERRIVEISNWDFKAVSILSPFVTFITWVAKNELKIQINIAEAAIMKGK